MNTRETAKFLGLTQRHIAWLCAKGEFIGANIDGKTWYIPKTSVWAWGISHGKVSRPTAPEGKPANAELMKTLKENEATQAVEAVL